MKTQTKTEIRNNTAKATKLLRGIDTEAAAISTAAEALNKRTAAVVKNAGVAAALLVGISNTALAAPAAVAKPVVKKADTKAAKKAAKKTAAKAAKKEAKAAAKAKPAAKTAAKSVVKKAATKTATKAAKPAAKAAGVKKPTAAKAAPAKPVKAGERPPLAQLMRAVLEKTPDVTAAAVNTALVAQGFKFSRQSQYNQLKKPELFSKKGEGAAATFRNASGAAATAPAAKAAPAAAPAPAAKAATSDADADAFVEKAGSNPVTAAAS